MISLISFSLQLIDELDEVRPRQGIAMLVIDSKSGMAIPNTKIQLYPSNLSVTTNEIGMAVYYPSILNNAFEIRIMASSFYKAYSSRISWGLNRIPLEHITPQELGLTIQFIDENLRTPIGLGANITRNGVYLGFWATTENGMISFLKKDANTGDTIIISTPGNLLYAKQAFSTQMQQNLQVPIKRNEKAGITVQLCEYVMRMSNGNSICRGFKQGTVTFEFKGKKEVIKTDIEGKAVLLASKGFWIGDKIVYEAEVVGVPPVKLDLVFANYVVWVKLAMRK